MPGPLYAQTLSRNELATSLVHIGTQSLEPTSLSKLAHASIPSRGAIVGRWRVEPGDPLPEILVIRDEDLADTLAWLNSFFAQLSPVTQWCRVLTQTQVREVATRSSEVTLNNRLAAWVGAILAECSVQSDGAVNLKEVPGSAALSTASFAAGRAVALLGDAAALADVARRHDELSSRLREGNRRVPAAALVALWNVIGGVAPFTRNSPDAAALVPFDRVLGLAFGSPEPVETADLIQQVALEATDHFELPELSECARGPQVERLRALDRLVSRLLSGPKTAAIEALIGLAASFIEPGTAVLPDMLRKYAVPFPIAPIWLGAFAGAWSPSRVIIEQQGLGRLITKALLAPSDLEGRPSSDIAYDELVRWLAPGRPNQRLEVRAMSARSLMVEISPGVSCAFAQGRGEPIPATQPRVEPARESSRPDTTTSRIRSDPRSIDALFDVVNSLAQRVERLESSVAVQSSLGLPDPRTGKTTRKKNTTR